MTKIDERRAREAYDKANPWRSMAEGVPVGTVCEILWSDMETTRDRLFILHEDGAWYQIQPPSRNYRSAMNWRPAQPPRKLDPAKRAEVVNEASKRGW